MNSGTLKGNEYSGRENKLVKIVNLCVIVIILELDTGF